MNPVQNNPLKTRQDMIDAAISMIRPLTAYLTPGKARLMLSATTAHYDEAVAGMEGFSRVLWALVPMLMGRVPEVEPYWALWKEGIIHGTDPRHEEYWGDIGSFDQRMVEMAVMGMGLCFVPDRFYDELPAEAQENLYRWLNQINQHDMPKNNWKFFRVLVNIGFLSIGREADEARLAADLDELESHYTGDGWYFDKPTQRDYYTLWGFHYYGLVYARAMMKRDPERCERFLARTRLMMPRFACWFDGQGRALPYGRSQTYRFAQGSFWSACALAEVTTEDIGWGEIKGLLLRNMRYWFSRPIFDRDGVLSVGYGYPNLVISEGYNAPGSPYWSFKAFVPLALPEEHPFWQTEEKPCPVPNVLCETQALQLLTRDADNTQVISYTAGNHAYEHMHEDEKYEKFAYSTHFGFSVVKEAGTLNKGAYDSMLAVKRTGRDLWHARSGCERYAVEPDRVTFTWSPCEGLRIDTVILPVPACGLWHIRKHVLHAEHAFEAAEGAFAVCRDKPGKRPCDRVRTTCETTESCAAAHGPFGTSVIYGLRGYAEATVISPEANTNLIEPRTVLPTLLAQIAPGETTLICAVYAATGDDIPDAIPEEVRNLAESC